MQPATNTPLRKNCAEIRQSCTPWYEPSVPSHPKNPIKKANGLVRIVPEKTLFCTLQAAQLVVSFPRDLPSPVPFQTGSQLKKERQGPSVLQSALLPHELPKSCPPGPPITQHTRDSETPLKTLLLSPGLQGCAQDTNRSSRPMGFDCYLKPHGIVIVPSSHKLTR